MTAPRLALLKSYSSRMVSICFAATGLASGNQARPLFALGVNDHKYSAQRIKAQRDEALLASRIRVFDRKCHRIAKRLLSVSEADAVLAQIGLGFSWVELEGHARLCILDAYVQVAPWVALADG